MGRLVEGVWHDQWYDTESTGGRFVREDSGFRDWITPDGTGAPEGRRAFPAEPGRYHLYVSLACPWAHRTLVLRALKGLEEIIDVSVVHPFMLENGWSFSTEFPGATGDALFGCDHLHEIYVRAKSDYTGRVTVPVLWDRQEGTIVSNESAEIIRMFDSAFDAHVDNDLRFCPDDLREEIDAINAPIYEHVNNGVYRTGFATSQAAYEEAFTALFDQLDALEARLGGQRYLVGNVLTEADWRLYTTLVRFDAVYFGHFKCNRRRIADYPALGAYLRDLYQHPGVATTTDLDHVRWHYYYSHDKVNPTRIVPLGPELGLTAPHGREALGEPEIRTAGGG